MHIIQEFFAVPDEIKEGLDSGKLFRNAAGIIRDSSGQIRHHLQAVAVQDLPSNPVQIREIIGKNVMSVLSKKYMAGNLNMVAGAPQVLANPLIGILICVQIAGFICLGRKLDKLQKTVENIERELRNANRKLDDLHDDNVSKVIECNQRAKEVYFNERYESVIDNAINARADIFNYLNNKDAVFLINHAKSLEILLRNFFESFFIYVQAADHSEQEQRRIPAVAKRYKDLFLEIHKKLLSFRDKMRVTLPNSYELEALRTFNTNRFIISLRSEAPALTASIDNAVEFLESGAGLRKSLEALSESDLKNISEHGCHIYVPA